MIKSWLCNSVKEVTGKNVCETEEEKRQRQYAQTMREGEETLALWEELAKQAEPDVLSKRQTALEEARARHAEDLAGFAFKCIRYGNFLTLFISRGNPPPKQYYVSEKNFSIALNLDCINSITLEEGHGPDENGVVVYRPLLTKGGTVTALYGGGGGYYDCPTPHKAPEGDSWKVIPEFPATIYAYELFFVPPPPPPPKQCCNHHWNSCNCGSSATFFYSDRNSFGGHDFPVPKSSQIKLQTPFPCMAGSDEIHFNPIGNILFVPAGKGQEVLDQILTASDIKKDVP